MQIHIARACGSCVDMRIWMFLMGSIMLQMAWAVWRSLYSQALHICWKHEEHEEHQQCWFKCRYNEHWERAQRTDTYFGMSVNAIVLRQTFILWSFVHGRFLWFALVLLLFFVHFSFVSNVIQWIVFYSQQIGCTIFHTDESSLHNPATETSRQEKNKHIPKERKRSFRMS